jgi:hypothetical protein
VIRASFFPVVIGLLLSGGSPASARPNGDPRFANYCVTIKFEAAPHDRVSVIDVVLENATITKLPNYPPGWQFDIKQEIEGNTVIFAAALGGVAQLPPSRLNCLFVVQNSFIDKGAHLSGKGSLSFGIEPQTHLVLRPDQFRFDKVGTAAKHSRLK